MFDKTSFEGELNILKTEAYVRQKRPQKLSITICYLYRERKFRNHYFRNEELRKRVEHPLEKCKEYSAQEIADFQLKARERMNSPIT